MLLRRRYLAPVALALIATPLLVGLVKPDGEASFLAEGRRPAPAPTMPAGLGELAVLPERVDAYLKDHFGLRRELIRDYNNMTAPITRGGGTLVMIGRDGRMFFLGDDMVHQSAGLILRDRRIAETADLLAQMKQALAGLGIKFLVAVPPNASTVYQEDLPIWAQRSGRRTEYDLFLAALADRGVKAVDLRPAVAAARAQGDVYFRHDTHWNSRGALAAFNAIVEADDHPDWRLDVQSSLGPVVLRPGGDLIRMLGADEGATETVQEMNFPVEAREEILSPGPLPDLVLVFAEAGPTVMVLGDSFTASYFPPMLSRRVARAVWLNHRLCAFDWKWIDRYRPDEVWWMPTERFLVCATGVRPAHFAG
ncbi:MAG: hypothetical protein JO288_06240 [Hyphomicrobiales bacterium]|nr:hypothetical protein [Hyphomicrobiales bacterium]